MIDITTKLGACALKISGKAKAEKQDEISKAGMASLVYRAGGSKLFGKDAHKRDEAFAPNLAKDAESVVSKVLGEFFDNVSIVVTEYVRPEPKSGLREAAYRASLEGLLDAADIEKAVAKAFPTAKADSSKEESEMESVG